MPGKTLGDGGVDGGVVELPQPAIQRHSAPIEPTVVSRMRAPRAEGPLSVCKLGMRRTPGKRRLPYVQASVARSDLTSYFAANVDLEFLPTDPMRLPVQAFDMCRWSI